MAGHKNYDAEGKAPGLWVGPVVSSRITMNRYLQAPGIQPGAFPSRIFGARVIGRPRDSVEETPKFVVGRLRGSTHVTHVRRKKSYEA